MKYVPEEEILGGNHLLPGHRQKATQMDRNGRTRGNSRMEGVGERGDERAHSGIPHRISIDFHGFGESNLSNVVGIVALSRRFLPAMRSVGKVLHSQGSHEDHHLLHGESHATHRQSCHEFGDDTQERYVEGPKSFTGIGMLRHVVVGPTSLGDFYQEDSSAIQTGCLSSGLPSLDLSQGAQEHPLQQTTEEMVETRESRGG